MNKLATNMSIGSKQLHIEIFKRNDGKVGATIENGDGEIEYEEVFDTPNDAVMNIVVECMDQVKNILKDNLLDQLDW